MQKMETFGGQLFDAVFSRDIYELYRTACQRVDDRNGGIRLVLSLRNAPELLDVPWEFLFDRPYWLSLRRRTPVVRVLELARVRNPVRVDGQLRILGMVSSPLGYPSLDVRAERQVIDNALAPLVEQGLAEVVWLPTASLPALNRALMSDEFHIFHYVGHAGFDRSSNEGVLVLEDSEGNVDEVSGANLGTILCDHRSLRLAVINACEGARAAPDDPFTGVATSLAEREIPAIVAMQYEITDTAALVFAQAFYGSLVERKEPVDVAVADARKALFADDPESLEWGTPVLFMRRHDVSLFEFGDRSPAPPRSGADTTQAAPVRAEPAVGRVTTPPSLSASAPGLTPAPPAAGPSDDLFGRSAKSLVDAPKREEPPDHLDPTPPEERSVDVTNRQGQLLVHFDEVIDLRHGYPLVAAAISSDGRLAATVGTDDALIAWNAETGQPVRKWTGLHLPHDVSLSHDGALIAVAADNGCWVFSTSSDRPMALLSPGKDSKRGVTAVQFNPDRATVVAGNDHGLVERWTLDKWRSIGKVEGPEGTGAINRLVSDSPGRTIAVATAKGQVWVWAPSRKPWTSRAVPAQYPAIDLVATPSGWAVATGTSVVIVDAEQDRVWRAQSLGSTVTTIDLMPDSMWLVAATQDCRVLAWDGSGELRLETRSKSVLSRVRFTPKGLFSAGADGIGRIWKVTQAN
jgi:hypothetical protein